MNPLVERPGLTIVERPGILCIVMRQAPDDALFDECSRALRDVRTRALPVSVVMLIPRFAGQMTASRATQRAFVGDMQSLGSLLIGTAIVIAEPGLKGTMIRMMVNTVLLLLVRFRAPIQIHANVPEMLAWVAKLPGQTSELRSAPFELERALLGLMRDTTASAPTPR